MRLGSGKLYNLKFGNVRRSLQALFLMVVSFLVVGGFARLIAQPAWLHLYENNYSFTPGSWFARRLNEARENPAGTCLLLGASSVREGFDEALITSLLAGQRVINMGTTGGRGAVAVIEIQARILASLGDHYECIVVGMHPLFLQRFESKSYDIVANDYAALLPLGQAFQLNTWVSGGNPIGKLLFTYFMPLAQHSMIIRRIAQEKLYNLHHILINSDTPLSQFEIFPNELRKQSQYNYDGTISVLKNIETSYAKLMVDLGWDDPRTYGLLEESESFQRALGIISDLSARLIVVKMPESFLFKNVERVAGPAYEAALRKSRAKLSALDCKIPEADNYLLFYDAVHLNQKGRDILSRSLARYLRGDNSNTQFFDANEICHLSSAIGR